MIRILFKLCFWVIIARWTYAEVKLLSPSAIPVIDYALQKIQIPTHDKWSQAAFDAWVVKAKSDSRESMLAMRAQVQESAGNALQHIESLSSVAVTESKNIRSWAKESEAFTRF